METKERLIGGAIFLASVLTTCFHEMNLIRSVQSLEEGRQVVVELAEPQPIPENNGILVLFSGLITVHDEEEEEGKESTKAANVLTYPFVLDTEFGIAARGVRLHRQVEMLQWVETSHVSTGNTNPEDEDRRVDDDRDRIYMYDLRWQSEVIDSNRFDDPSYWNPPEEAWIYQAKVIKTSNLVVGDFVLTDELVDQIQRRDEVPLDASNRWVMSNQLDVRVGEGWMQTSALRNATIKDNYFYILTSSASDPAHAELGDLRVSFQVTPAYAVTICAQQQGRNLLPFRTTAGHQLYLLEDGIHNAHELFDKKTNTKFSHNRFYRLFASVLGFIGFLVVHPLLIKSRFGATFARLQTHLLSSSLSVALTFSVVGINWLWYRPFWAVAMWLGGLTPMGTLLAYQFVKKHLKNE